MLPKIAVAVSPKGALDITKSLMWEKNKQGELEVLEGMSQDIYIW